MSYYDRIDAVFTMAGSLLAVFGLIFTYSAVTAQDWFFDFLFACFHFFGYTPRAINTILKNPAIYNRAWKLRSDPAQHQPYRHYWGRIVLAVFGICIIAGGVYVFLLGWDSADARHKAAARRTQAAAVVE